MIDEEKAITFIESSFLRNHLLEEGVTDISFNGLNLFYQHNFMGRVMSNVEVTKDQVMDFLRQISNLAEKKFSIQEPILDITVGKYRLNAIHPSIGRKDHKKVPTFALRIASNNLRVKEDKFFLPDKVVSLLKNVLDNHASIVIGGITGSGKTELQKYLISLMRESTRVIVIDNVLELDSLLIENNIDLTVWQYDDQKENISIAKLVRNALRSNPDWLIIAESRGEEMREVLNSALTGHPIITTLHAKSIDTMSSRIVSMVMMSDKKTSYRDVKNDVFSHFKVYIFLTKKEEGGMIVRYINEIAFLYPSGKKETVYFNDGKSITYYPLNDELIKSFTFNDIVLESWK